MEVIKTNVTTQILEKPISQKEVTFIWGHDGWCYIPELLIRQKFPSKHVYISEPWGGTIPLPEFIEKVNWYLYSENPRKWREQGEGFDEMYELLKPIKKKV